MKGNLVSTILFARACLATPANQALFQVSQRAQNGFLWSSVGLAVLTAFLQGFVTALAFMTESSNYWTFRFRIARIEPWWWTLVSATLLVSLVLMILSFLAGNNNEAISALALSTATFLTIVQYLIPSWRSRHFLENRWLAWTGSSRTSIQASKAVFCGDKAQWTRLVREVHLSNIQPTPSDWYGWRLWPTKSIPEDPTDILRNVDINRSEALGVEARNEARFIYSTGDDEAKTVSLLWGEHQGFRRRVSRATSSMPSNLLQSRPFTVDGYVGNGLCLAMGILGRNKGLQPKNLVFNMSRAISTSMEDSSTWAPRPNKVLRSYYMSTLRSQYSGLGPAYIDAATELALLLMDIPPLATAAWLTAGMEQQSIRCNGMIAEADSDDSVEELRANYESSYVSMVTSLNYMDARMGASAGKLKGQLASRPDVLCTGLLLKARGAREPIWWNQKGFVEAREKEMDALGGDLWREPMALLLGLRCWPSGFEESPSVWDGVSVSAQKEGVVNVYERNFTGR
ncbi:hypothetical protein N7G274_003905 [Stereocaulon virgatum]|uniref:Uncharacterized protein n=1 Tax=Stereocaulon virgatum TaxID=373712 RepID=A0ABR4AJK9_9LECA